MTSLSSSLYLHQKIIPFTKQKQNTEREVEVKKKLKKKKVANNVSWKI